MFRATVSGSKVIDDGLRGLRDRNASAAEVGGHSQEAVAHVQLRVDGHKANVKAALASVPHQSDALHVLEVPVVVVLDSLG